jgi:hypothetical protein
MTTLGKPKTAQTTVQTEAVAIPVEQELTLLRGFRDLVGQRWGIFVGRRLKQQDLSEKTETERKAVTEVRKDINKSLPTWVEKGDKASYDAKMAELKTASEAFSEAKKATGIPPVIKSLAQGQRYLDNEAIPNALSELGTPVQPAFSLAEWLKNRLEEQKKAKKARK